METFITLTIIFLLISSTSIWIYYKEVYLPVEKEQSERLKRLL